MIVNHVDAINPRVVSVFYFLSHPDYCQRRKPSNTSLPVWRCAVTSTRVYGDYCCNISHTFITDSAATGTINGTYPSSLQWNTAAHCRSVHCHMLVKFIRQSPKWCQVSNSLKIRECWVHHQRVCMCEWVKHCKALWVPLRYRKRFRPVTITKRTICHSADA